MNTNNEKRSGYLQELVIKAWNKIEGLLAICFGKSSETTAISDIGGHIEHVSEEELYGGNNGDHIET